MVRLVNTIASNATGLYKAREIIPGVLPVTADNGGQPVKWYEREPNDYGDFGADVTRRARQPINNDRQRKKGTPVGQTASAGFTQDLTATNTVEDFEEFCFAEARRKSRLLTAGVTATGYTVTEGGLDYVAGTLVFAKGHGLAANNGLREITADATDIEVSAAGLFVDGTLGEISRVGFQFPVADLAVVTTGPLPQLVSDTVDLTTLGLIPGEIIYVGDAGHNFAIAANRGYARVFSVTETAITLDKTDAPFVATDGAGVSVRIFFGTVIKNEKAALQKTYTSALRRLLGQRDLDNDAIQSEVVTRCVANELTLDIPEEDIITTDLAYIGADYLLFGDDAEEVGGVFIGVEEADAINSTRDSVRASMIAYPPGGNNSAPIPLFAAFTELSLTINNNVSENKAVTVYGAYSLTPGFFEVNGSFDAYFCDVESLRAVRDNKDVSFLFAGWKERKGFAIDLPMLGINTGGLDVAVNEPITCSVDGEAATGKKYNAAMDHTILLVFFDYLPQQAAV